MNCLKCGRETDQTFCEYCRETMEKYPVKPGSFVVLPKRNQAVKRNPPRRDTIPPENRILKLRRIVRRMALTIAALVVLIAAMGYAIYQLIVTENEKPVGQNYSTVTKPTESTDNASESAESTEST